MNTKFHLMKKLCMAPIFATALTLVSLSTSAHAQRDFRYEPQLNIRKPNDKVFNFNDGKGRFSCSRFVVRANTASGSGPKLFVDINCADNRNDREIRVLYNEDIYNIRGRTHNPPYTAVLVCEGTCRRIREGSNEASFSRLRIGNLSATVKNRFQLSEFSCGPIVNDKCSKRPIEIKIDNRGSKPVVSVRISSWKTFEQYITGVKDDDDPVGPKAARYAGGEATVNSELAVTENE